MTTMAATNVRDLGPKEMQTRHDSSTRIDLANIGDVPYYVESIAYSILFRFKNENISLERYVRAVDNGDEFQYEEVPVEDYYDDGR